MTYLLALCLIALAAAPARVDDTGVAGADAVVVEAPGCRPASDSAQTVHSGLPSDPAAPEPASGYRPGRRAVATRSFMVVTANPLASEAGCRVIAAGGSAVDAAVAAQMVLGLVEPQSSGLGGGAFLLHYDAATHAVQAYDGRETAPAAADENDLRRIDGAHPSGPAPTPRASGRSIGTPGLLRLLELAHHDHGRLPWKTLIYPAIRMARDGFAISGRLASAIASARVDLLRDAQARAVYLDADANARPPGAVLQVPAYALTLAAVADGGADAFYRGSIARAIVESIGATHAADDGSVITPGKTSLADLAGYRAKRREPVCAAYRAHWVCGMPPPSSGGIAVAATLGILEHFDLGALAPAAIDLEGGRPRPAAVHLVSEAERLAYADRDAYVADPDFVDLPGGSPAALLAKPYLQGRAALIEPQRSLGTALPGRLSPTLPGIDRTPESGTSHLTIVDRAGNVVVMTSTVESSFGSFHMAAGFMLNNQLTDFSAAPADADGRPIANRLQPGKRPRSAMAPTLVFERNPDGSRGNFVLGTGSPGGGAIIQYVVKTLVGALDWGLDAQQSAGLVDFGALNGPVTSVGAEHPNVGPSDDALVAGLRERGHTVSVRAQSSGIATVMRAQASSGAKWQGGADPRREGVALGDPPGP